MVRGVVQIPLELYGDLEHHLGNGLAVYVGTSPSAKSCGCCLPNVTDPHPRPGGGGFLWLRVTLIAESNILECGSNYFSLFRAVTNLVIFFFIKGKAFIYQNSACTYCLC